MSVYSADKVYVNEHFLPPLFKCCWQFTMVNILNCYVKEPSKYGPP